MYRYPPSPLYYCGVYFRARLEARWAALFDEVGMRWLYECEWLTLSSGPYTPDFWLPEPNITVEIKPGMEFCDARRYKEYVRLSQRAFLLIAGEPNVGQYALRYFPVNQKKYTGQLGQAQFARHQSKLWIVQNEHAICLTANATPIPAPPGLEINSPWLALAMKRAN